jgi:hypothetical protein
MKINEFLSSYFHPDTHVTKKLTQQEYGVQLCIDHKFEKEELFVTIQKLEKDLLYYSQHNMEYRMLPNTREDIMDRLKIYYKYRDELYCAGIDDFPDMPLGY